MLGAVQKVDDGELEMTPAFEQQLTNMIRNSSNADASSVLDKVGAPYLADLLQSDRYQLYKKEGTGGLWVGRPYSRGPVWKRDPINNISHGASSHEIARFYYLLATGRLVSQQSCEVMLDILSDPAIKHKFVSGLKQYPDAEIMRKPEPAGLPNSSCSTPASCVASSLKNVSTWEYMSRGPARIWFGMNSAARGSITRNFSMAGCYSKTSLR